MSTIWVLAPVLIENCIGYLIPPDSLLTGSCTLPKFGRKVAQMQGAEKFVTGAT
jgi:hypothetical protein